jgi:hypothetical protein
VGNDPYGVQLSHAQCARLDLHLVLANMTVLFGLVMTRMSHASDGTAESVLAMV